MIIARARFALPPALLAGLVAASPAVASDCEGPWQHQGVPTPESNGLLYGIDVGPDGATWAVGRYSVQISQFSWDDQPFATSWDGTSWSTSSVPNPSPMVAGQRDASFSDVAVIAADDVWAVGTYRRVGADGFPGFQTLAMHWDGTTWSVVPTPLTPVGGTGGFLKSIDAIAPDNIWAAGTRIAPENLAINTTALLLHWDGTSWTEIPDAPWIQKIHIIEDIRAFSDGTVWCAGHFGEVQGQNPWLARWDGTDWTLYEGLPVPPGITALDAIDGHSPDDVWVAGRSTTSLGTFAIVLHWDGVAWTWDAPDVSDMESVKLYGIGVTPGGTVHVSGVWTNEPSPATPLPFLAHRDPDGTWSALQTVEGAPASAWYRDLVVEDNCRAWAIGQQQPLIASAARLDSDVTGPSPDIDGDGTVGPVDLAMVLDAWGPCRACPADLNADGMVGPADLALILDGWSAPTP